MKTIYGVPLDRVLLLASFVLLVVLVAFQSWDTQRSLHRIDENVCAVAEVAVAAPLFNISIYGEQQGVDSDNVQLAIATLISVAEAIQEQCGVTFLDEIEAPELGLVPDE